MEALQAALDAWREDYNTDRPHQSLEMAFPASRSTPACSPLACGHPRGTAWPAPQLPAPRLPAKLHPPASSPACRRQPLEVDRVVPPSGNLWIGGELAGQRITLRMDGTVMAVISHGGVLLRTLPCPVPAADRRRLRGAHRAATIPPPSTGPVTVQRRVSQRGSIVVATQRIHVGIIHARKTVDVTAEEGQFLLVIDGEMIGTVPRTTAREIHRYKAYARHVKAPSAPGSATEEDLQR